MLLGGALRVPVTRGAAVARTLAARANSSTMGEAYVPTPAAKGAPQGGLTLLPSIYPSVPRDEGVVEDHFGVRIPDPYRALEEPDSAATREFVDAQIALTEGVLEQCETRGQFKTLLTELWDYEKFGCPARQGARYVYSYNSGLLNQYKYYSMASLDGEPRLLIDPNDLSEDGTVALAGSAFSEDGCLFGYMLSSGGSDWRTVHVKTVDPDTGAVADLPDRLEHVKFSGLTWTHDGLGFFYCGYEPPSTSDAGTEVDKNVNQQLRYHVLGTSQDEDRTVLAIPEEPTWMLGSEVTNDGRYLLLSVSNGCEPVNQLWVVDLMAVPKGAGGALDFARFDFHTGTEPLPLVKLVDDFRASWDYIGSDGEALTFQTNLDAPRYRVVRCPSISSAGAPDSWPSIIPQDDKDLLQWACLIKGGTQPLMAVCWLRDVVSKLELRAFANGALVRELPMPGIGSVGGFSGSWKHSEFFFSFTSFVEPGAIFRVDAADVEPTPQLFRRIACRGFSPDDFETKQVFVASKDGTRIPMFIVHRKGLALDGTAPTLLYGYGGFNISLEPGFSVSRVCWMLAYNGVYAVANLRGGGEYGIEWRNSGSCGKKQNVFDDFQACAEYLHSSGYSSPHTLTIQGGSNGGLLVAACINQRPDLYQAALAQVGVHDMLRFALFTIGHAWCTDYGDPSTEEGFGWVLPYSPLHNVALPADGGQYPAVLLTTGDHDDRVVPLHSHKLIATLQHVLAGSPDSPQRNPLITRIEVRAGHGAGKPTSKILAETSDSLAFAAKACGATWQYKEPSAQS